MSTSSLKTLDAGTWCYSAQRYGGHHSVYALVDVDQEGQLVVDQSGLLWTLVKKGSMR